MGLVRLSIREFQRRWVRTLLTIVSIVIGVAAVVSISLATSAARQALSSLDKAVTGNASLEIHAEGGGSFEESLESEIQSIPGVRLLAPSLRRNSNLYLPDNRKVRVQVLGVNLSVDVSMRDYKLSRGRLIDAADELMLDESFARSLRIELDTKVRLLTASGMQTATVVGMVKPAGASAVGQGGVVIVPLKTSQKWYKSQGRINSLSVLVKDGEDVSSVQGRIKELIKTGMDVRPPATSSRSADESTMGIENGLRLATIFALVIAIFLIYNTFQMTVGERRRQFGIMRALGTTRRQIVGMVLKEAFLLAAIGVVLGWGAGLVGASLISKGTQALLGVEVPWVGIKWQPLAISAACGFGVTLLGAFVPAYLAGRMHPSEALRIVSNREFSPPSIPMTFIGFLAFATGSTLLAGAVFERIPSEFGPLGLFLFIGLVLFFVGWLLILPGILGPFSHFVHWLTAPWFGMEGRLARNQLLRHRGRTALTIGVLFLATSTGLGMANTIMDNIRDIQHWYQRAIVGDFFIRAAMPDMATGLAADMPVDLPEKLRAISGIQRLDSLRFVRARSGETTVIVVVREFTSEMQDYFALISGEGEQVLQGLQDGKVVLGSVLAQRSNLKIGDSIPLQTLEGEKSLEIAGITNDYIGGGLTLYMTRTMAIELFHVEGSDAYVIQADDQQLAQVEERLEAFCQEEGLMLQSFADLVSYIRTIVNGLTASLWAVVALGSLIAAFGLVNTLAMSILEQTREIGMLRVVAMTRAQIRNMVLSQAFQMGLIAIIPGVPAGLLIAYVINLSTLPTTGHAIEFTLRPRLIIGTGILEMLLVSVAALIPAARAARIRLADALQYE